jgi:hypothetical protein
VLQLFLDKYLGNRKADMHPGLRFRREWTPAEAAEIEGNTAAGGRWCDFRDAEGNIFEIKERHRRQR